MLQLPRRALQSLASVAAWCLMLTGCPSDTGDCHLDAPGQSSMSISGEFMGIQSCVFGCGEVYTELVHHASALCLEEPDCVRCFSDHPCHGDLALGALPCPIYGSSPSEPGTILECLQSRGYWSEILASPGGRNPDECHTYTGPSAEAGGAGSSAED